MDNRPMHRPQQILVGTLVGVGLLVLLAAGVAGRFSAALAVPPTPTPPLPAPVTFKASPATLTPTPQSADTLNVAWPPLTATPITNLATLVQQSDAVARVKITGGNGAQHSHMVYIAVQEWFKTPAQVITGTGVVWILDPFAGEFTPPRLSWISDGAEGVLFLRVTGLNPWDDGSLAYELTGAPEGDTAIYQLRDGRISDAGLPQYRGWTLADFAAAIRALLPHPELGLAPAGPW